ncbi:MAG: glycosyltransferase [Rhodobacteraceae bacterium]|nr:glycosyltransferase [Paracoccaceae bacterium]
MTLPTASVVVVSRDRPEMLCRTVLGLRHLDHPAFEVVVVADPPGLAALAQAGLDGPLKTARFGEANIAAARNAGIALAAGEVVAFLDDDAVPEPTWLSRLTAPLAGEAAAATGFVRGRNGISLQWGAVEVAADARERPLQSDGTRIVPPGGGHALKLQGTNMAVRRDVLARLGGFDPAYRFYLDDTDLSLRIGAAGHAAALVPGAEVHHAFAPSPRRGTAREPLSLTEIGASLAVFLDRHAPPGLHAAAIDRQRRAEHARLVRHLGAGRIGPRDVARLKGEFELGLAEGAARPPPALIPLPPPTMALRPFPACPAPMRRLAGWSWQARRLRAEAAALAAGGVPVTLFLFGVSARPHWLRFTEGGWWEQTGGLFGRADRDGPRVRPARFATRLAEETHRLSRVRSFDAPAP